jgi:hypothetical protein
MLQPSDPMPKSRDVRCLKCGSYNIPDNRICGKCGASLPVIYDDHGQVFRWEEAQGFEGLMNLPEKGKRGPSVNRTRWLLRGMILLIALLFAFYLLSAHK